MNRVVELKAGVEDDDLYSGYNEYPSTFDIKDLENDEIFQAALQKSSHGRKNLFKPGTAFRVGLKSGYHGISSSLGYRGLSRKGPLTSSSRQPTGMPPQSSFTEEDFLRPMTAVRGVGYTSHGRPGTGMFDPLNQRINGPMIGLEKKEETPEEKVKKLERQIMELIEQSSILHSKGQKKDALGKAKEASSKERSLIRVQEHSGLSETHNLDLTFLVLFNLATQYSNNEMYTEALNTYQVITKNKMFTNASRLKMNMGNIYYKLGQYSKAIKMYRMAMDQVPNTHKDLRIKIMHNIGSLFLKTGEILEACQSFEYIMQEKPDFKAGLNLVYCYHTLSDPEKMKKAFQSMLTIPLNVDNDKYNQASADDHQSQLLLEVIKNDKLRLWEKEQQEQAEKNILCAAKMISPVIEDNYAAGYNWCLEAVKSSKYASLASDLDLDKVVMLLKQRDINGAVEILNVFQDKEPRIASIAANNLCFISYLQGDMDQAEKWGESAKELDSYNASAYVNLGNIAYSRRNFEQAKEFYEVAYENDSLCVEALYNLGLVNKQLGRYEESLAHFMKLETIIRHDPAVLYHLATLNEFIGDVDQASEWYLQLLGIVPSDPGVLQELGQLFEREGDKQQAFQYHFESYRYYPSNFDVLDWLAGHYMSLGVPEKALQFLERAVMIAPSEPKWQLLMASCYKKIGNHQKAVEVYKNLHKENPDNVECLQLLVRLTSEFGLKEAGEYVLELKRAEKAKEVRERIGSSRPGSRRSSGRSAGFTPSSPTPLRISPTQIRSNPGSAALGGKFGQFNMGQSISESDEILYSAERPREMEIRYVDPLGPAPERPRTSVERKASEDDFGDEELGEDLLPE